MMRTWFRLVAMVAAAALASAACATLGGGKGTAGELPVLMIAPEGSQYIDIAVSDEAGRMIDMLRDAGYKVVVATESGKPLVAEARTVTPDLPTASVRAADYCGLIMPCMNTARISVSDAAVAIAKEMAASGKPIAAQRKSVGVLAKAGLLKGIEYSAAWTISSDGTFVPDSVVQAGSVITSAGCPASARYDGTIDGTVELTQRFIAALRG